MACQQHEKICADFICKTCNNAPICKECKTGFHRKHTVRTPREVADDIKNDFKELLAKDIHVIADTKYEKGYLLRSKEEQRKENMKVEIQIGSQRERIHAAVDEVTVKLLASYKSKMDQNCDILDERSNQMKQHIETTSNHRSEVRAILAEIDDVKDINKAVKVINKTERLVANRILKFDVLKTATYTPGEIDLSKLEEMMGCSVPNVKSNEANRTQHCVDVHTAKTNVSTSSVENSSDIMGSVHVHQQSCHVKQRTSFQCSKNLLTKSFAFEIWPTEKRFTWINYADKNKFRLFDGDGRREKTLKPENLIGGMFVTPKVPDSMLFCCYGDRWIRQVSGLEFRVSKVFSTEPLYPRCVCRSMKDDEIHVTLVDRNDFEITPGSTRCVATFKNGIENRRAEKDKFGDLLFVKPSRIKLNKTDDILAVVNRTDKYNTHLVLLNKDLTLKLRYLGNNTVLDDTNRFQCQLYSPEIPYTINDFDFIDGNNILLCELYSRCVQLLTADCRSLITVLPQDYVVPYSLACFADRMWVGYFDGSVKVYDILF